MPTPPLGPVMAFMIPVTSMMTRSPTISKARRSTDISNPLWSQEARRCHDSRTTSLNLSAEVYQLPTEATCRRQPRNPRLQLFSPDRLLGAAVVVLPSDRSPPQMELVAGHRRHARTRTFSSRLHSRHC